jgi:cytochrome P450
MPMPPTSAPVAAQAGAPVYPPTVTPPAAPLPLWRFLPTFVRNPLRALPQQVYDGDMLLMQRGRSMTIAWLSAPHLVEQVLLTDADKVEKSPAEKRVFGLSLANSVLIADGADWRWQRRAMAPLFRAQDIQSYLPAMLAAADAQVERWRLRAASQSAASQTGAGALAADDLTWTIDQDMLRVTYDVILATMLVGGQSAETELILQASGDYLARVSWELAFGLLRLPAWLPHPARWQMRRASAQMRGAVAAIISRRRAAATAPDLEQDLLGRLLAARHPDSGEPMSDALLISNLLTLLEAGHETTAKALTWTLYLLARAPDWQERVVAEVNAVAGDGPLLPEHIGRLPVTLRVLKESMRLYPPAPVIARVTTQPLQLGGHLLPIGTQIVIPIFAIHRHRKLWDDPDRFDPDRFLPTAEAGRPRTQYMPFGGGPRVCIGAAFAMTEATALLATLVRAAQFRWDGRHLPEPVSRVTLRPKGGMPLRVTLRRADH